MLLFYYLSCLTEVSQGYVKTLKITSPVENLQYSVMNQRAAFCKHLIQ